MEIYHFSQCQCHHFKVRFKQPSVFLDFSKLLWMEADTKKSTKLHLQPGNQCKLKVYKPIYIDYIGCIGIC